MLSACQQRPSRLRPSLGRSTAGVRATCSSAPHRLRGSWRPQHLRPGGWNLPARRRAPSQVYSLIPPPPEDPYVSAHESDPTPLLDAVADRGSRSYETPLHFPGHKRGQGMPKKMQQLLGSAPGPLQYDLTELEGLDFLSSPSGPIAESQKLAAEAFGADRTWFLVNGCSVGVHAAVMATVKPGQSIIIARNSHISAFSACVLTGCSPLWLQPELDPVHGVPHCPTPKELNETFQRAWAQGADVGAVILVSPTYYGVAAKIAELASICHDNGVPLIVDEAHGAHFAPASLNLPRIFPPSALSCGADLVVQSTHKVLTSMTQTAMLHLKGDRVNPDRIAASLQVLQTSSPSYLLLASLDAARYEAVQTTAWVSAWTTSLKARRALEKISGLVLMDDAHVAASESVGGFDPLRVVVNVADLGLTGYEAAKWLEEAWGVVPEMSTLSLVVFVFGPGSTPVHADNLVNALLALKSHQLDQRLKQQAQQQLAARSSAAAGADALESIRTQAARQPEPAAAAPAAAGVSGGPGLEQAAVDNWWSQWTQQLQGGGGNGGTGPATTSGPATSSSSGSSSTAADPSLNGNSAAAGSSSRNGGGGYSSAYNGSNGRGTGPVEPAQEVLSGSRSSSSSSASAVGGSGGSHSGSSSPLASGEYTNLSTGPPPGSLEALEGVTVASAHELLAQGILTEEDHFAIWGWQLREEQAAVQRQQAAAAAAFDQQLKEHSLWCSAARRHLVAEQLVQQRRLYEQQLLEQQWRKQLIHEQQLQQQEELLLRAVHLSERRRLQMAQASTEQLLLHDLETEWREATAASREQEEEEAAAAAGGVNTPSSLQLGEVWVPATEYYFFEGAPEKGASREVVRGRVVLPFWEVDEGAAADGEPSSGKEARGSGSPKPALTGLLPEEVAEVVSAVSQQQWRVKDDLQAQQEDLLVQLVEQQVDEREYLWQQQQQQLEVLRQWQRARQKSWEQQFEFQRLVLQEEAAFLQRAASSRQLLIKSKWLEMQEGEVKGLHTMHQREKEYTGAITEEDPEGGTLVAAPGALLLKARHTAALKDLKQRYDELDKEGIDWEAFLRYRRVAQGWERYEDIEDQLEDLLAQQQEQLQLWQQQQEVTLQQVVGRRQHLLEEGLKQLAASGATVSVAWVVQQGQQLMTLNQQVATAGPLAGQLPPREAHFADKVRVSLDDAVGLLSGELVCPYPPGVPLLYPGEKVTPQVVETLRAVLSSGGVVTGASDRSCATLLVLQAPKGITAQAAQNAAQIGVGSA